MSASLRIQHATEEQLLRALDGELTRQERAAVEEHVAACWGCRHKQDQLRQAMGCFTEFESVLAESGAAQPPGEWREFPVRLRECRLSMATVPAAPSGRARAGAAALGALTMASAVMWLWPAQPVSAKEILHRTAISERSLIGAVRNPVVKQKVRVESARGKAEGAFWNAVEAGQAKREWSRSENGVPREVEGFYAGLGLDLHQPVSVNNHVAWRKGAAEDRVENDGDRIRIVSRKGDAEAELVVRASDWHAVEQRFSVGGQTRYRLIETGFEVVGMTAEMAKIFAPEPPLRETEGVAEAVASSARVELPVWPAAPQQAAVNPQDLMEAELGALWVVRHLGAGRLDAAQVARSAGSVRVTLYGSDAATEAALRAIPHVELVAPATGEELMPTEQRAIERAEQPLFLKELIERTGSLAGANAMASQPLQLLRRLQVELAAERDLESRFPLALRLSLSSNAQEKWNLLVQAHRASAQTLWRQTEASSPLLLSAIGIEPQPRENCGAAESAQDLLFAAKRVEELYARAFTAVAGADAGLRWMTKGALREEAVSLYAVLASSFAENCR